MANIHQLVHKMDKVNIKNLINGDGIILDVENEMMSDNEDDYVYSQNVKMTPNEIANTLCMDDYNDEADDELQPFIYDQGSFSELKEKMEDISNGQGKVYKYVVKNGVGDPVPENSRVAIRYVGYFEFNDEPFDSTALHDSNCMSLRLNNGEMIPGLDLGVSTMRKYETAVFIIHPDYAYGEMGCFERIPPNAEVLFNVTLVDIIDDSKVMSYEALSSEEKQTFASIESYLESLMKSANSYFKKKNVKQAIRDYNTAVRWLERVQLHNDEEENKMKKWLSRVYSNLGVCYLKQNKARPAVRALHLVYDGYHTAKTYYNLGKALGQLGEHNEAMVELQKALQLDPNSAVVRKHIAFINEQKMKYKEAEKQLWKNCLNITHEPKNKSAFEQDAEDYCDKIANDTELCRLPIPPAFTHEELKILGLAAAARGLSIMKEERYGKNTYYISKRNLC